MAWDAESDAEKRGWASDEAVRAVLAEAGIEPDERDAADERLGGPDCRARDAVIADADYLPPFNPEAPTRAEAMRAARTYDSWRRAGGGTPWWERTGSDAD